MPGPDPCPHGRLSCACAAQPCSPGARANPPAKPRQRRATRAFGLGVPLLLLLAAFPCGSAEPPRRDDGPLSVLTVDQLLGLENERAREAVRRAREGLVPAGTQRSAPGASPDASAPEAVPAIIVESVARLGDGAVRLALWVDGRRIDAATLGTRVGMCEIVRVAGACVHMAPVATKRRRQAAGGSCPTACWTGAPIPPARGAGPLAGSPTDSGWSAAAPSSAFAQPPALPAAAPVPRPGREPASGAPVNPVAVLPARAQ